MNRAPFDLAEAESELVAGFHTEYSGLRWSFFFMAEYGSMFAVSALAAILFFGGWNGPIPITHLLGMAYEPGETWSVFGYLANLIGMTNFVLKTCLFVTLMIWVRWTLPRLRIDQVMTTCLKYCTPLAAICFLGAAGWLYVLPGGLLLPGTPYGIASEGASPAEYRWPEKPSARQESPDASPSARKTTGKHANSPAPSGSQLGSHEIARVLPAKGSQLGSN